MLFYSTRITSTLKQARAHTRGTDRLRPSQTISGLGKYGVPCLERAWNEQGKLTKA